MIEKVMKFCDWGLYSLFLLQLVSKVTWEAVYDFETAVLLGLTYIMFGSRYDIPR